MTIESDELVAVPAQAPDAHGKSPSEESRSSTIPDDAKAPNSAELTWAVVTLPDGTEVSLPTVVPDEAIDDTGNPTFSIGMNLSGSDMSIPFDGIDRYCELAPRSPGSRDDPSCTLIHVRPLDDNFDEYNVYRLEGTDIKEHENGARTIRGPFTLFFLDDNGDPYELKVTPSGWGASKDFWVDGMLAAGGEGKVFKALVKRPSPSFPAGTLELAIKVSRRTKYIDAEEAKVVLDIMKASPNDNVVMIYRSNGDEKSTHNIIVMELMVGDLTQCLRTMQTTNLKNVSGQLLKGLQHLHEIVKLSHGDLKASNTLVNRLDVNDPEFTVKLGDFGCSKIGDQKRLAISFTGTKGHQAPEINPSHRTFRTDAIVDGFKTDRWAFGKTIYYFIDGRHSERAGCVWNVTLRDVMTLARQIDHGADLKGRTNFVHFIMSFLKDIPGDRYTPRQGLAHLWLSEESNDSTCSELDLKRKTSIAFGPADDDKVADDARPEKREK